MPVSIRNIYSFEIRVKFILPDNEITSEQTDSEVNVYLDKISSAMYDLSSTTDAIVFIERMIPIGALLSSLDQKLNDFFPEIDENTQDPTYFIATYFDTKNLTDALLVYKTIRSL